MTSIIKVDQIQKADGSVPTVKDLGLEAGSVIQCKAQTQTIGNTGDDADITTTVVSATGISGGLTINTVNFTPKYSDSLVLMQWSGMVQMTGAPTGGGDIFFTKDNANLLTSGGNRNAVGFIFHSDGPDDFYTMSSAQYSFTAGQTSQMALKVVAAAYSSSRSIRFAHDGTTTLTVWEIAQ
jgi:hypothetical protein